MDQGARLPNPEPAGERGNPCLIDGIRREIEAAGGRLAFARFMELTLYHPEYGYYLTAQRRPGRGGDFLTAPEVHPFFGMTLARQLAECWERLGRPESWVVREYGAGVGGLAYDIIAGLSTESPEAVTGLRFRLVEPNRSRLEQALGAMAEVGLDHIVEAEAPPAVGVDLPPIVGVALANEVADALPVHRLVMRDGRLRERYVVWAEEGFGEVEGELSASVEALDLPSYLRGEGVTLAEGNAIEVSPAAAAWFGGVARGIERGYAIVLDYGYAAGELYRAHRLEGTLRAHYQHTVTDNPYLRVGEQDLTAHVDFTALERAGIAAGMRPVSLTTQGEFLAGLGMGDFLVRLQDDPETTLADYYAAQSAVLRLIDPGGMGRFGVLVMARGMGNGVWGIGHWAGEGACGMGERELVGDDGVLLFLSGEDMDPRAVLTAYPGARFVARARLDEAGEEEAWGILVQVADRDGWFATGARQVVTDDQRVAQAVPVTDAETMGDAAAVIAAARYWELPPAYVQRLRGRAAVADVEDEE